MKRSRFTVALALASLVACRSTYVSRLGLDGGEAKADLAQAVDEAKEAQVDGQRRFQAAFRAFDRMLSAGPDDDYDDLFDDFQDELAECARASGRLRGEIVALGESSEVLFTEWEAALELYTNPVLRDKSGAMLAETRLRVDELIADLMATEVAIDPVLENYGDYALFFHHNLNATAIGTLADTRPGFQQLNGALFDEIDSDIDAATSFGDFLDGRYAAGSLVVSP